MSQNDGRYVVTYNGEIYNHIELRSELEAAGERFVSDSDTEVLLAAYKAWGRGCVERFRGMFAFALWDNKDKTVFLARDRCGDLALLMWRAREQGDAAAAVAQAGLGGQLQLARRAHVQH